MGSGGGTETGERRLNRAAADRKADTGDRSNQLIQSHIFRTNLIGKKDPVEESKDARKKSGSCQNQGSA